MKTLLFVLLCALTATACSPAVTDDSAGTPIAPQLIAAAPTEAPATRLFPAVTPMPYETLVSLFDYDQMEPLGYRETGQVIRGEITVRDVSYNSPNGGQVNAFLVIPPGDGPFAGIVFLHRGGSSRRQFLNEAIQYANLGAVGLLLDDNFSPTGRPRDRDRLIQIVNDVRRGVDLLTSRSDVDPQRIAFVGHSYGANLGGVLAGVEHRITAYVFMSGNARMSQDLIGLFNITTTVEAQYLDFMAQLDGIHFIGHAAPAALLFQNARNDALNPEQEALDFQQTASEPKTVKWYEAYHQLNAEADQDRAEWLQQQLDLKAVPPLGEGNVIGYGWLRQCAVAGQRGPRAVWRRTALTPIPNGI
jgi:dienelactone hydrolase